MKSSFKSLIGALATGALVSPGPTAIAAASKEARVTQIIREVKLLPADAAAREAALNDKVSEDTGVRTGGESRSELTFSDLTITRLGANTIFSFSKSGRTANVDSGSILLRVPKDSGGGSIRSSAVTVAITGTTVIFEGSRAGRSKLITLEGLARVSLKANPAESRQVLAGQMLEVPAGATTLPMPVNIDLKQLMRTHPLITDFKPLPSAPLIMAVAQQPPPRSSGPSGPFITPPPHHAPHTTTPPAPADTPKTSPRPTRAPATNQPPGTTKPPITTHSPPAPTQPPIITRTAPTQTRTPSRMQLPTRVQKKSQAPSSGPR